MFQSLCLFLKSYSNHIIDYEVFSKNQKALVIFKDIFNAVAY